MKIHSDTPLFRATLSLLKRIDDSLPTDFNVDCYIFGGVAIHLYTGERPTTDVDVEFSKRILLQKDFVIFSDQEESSLLYIDTQFNTMFALIHEDYQADAIFIHNEMRKIRLHVISPIDLAVSKLSRFSDIDQADIVALARHGLIDADSLEKRARQALSSYVGDSRNVEFNLLNAINAINEIQSEKNQKICNENSEDVKQNTNLRP
jgi:hypothetical protein